MTLLPDATSAALLEGGLEFCLGSKYALQLYSKPSSTARQMERFQRMIARK